MADTPGMQPQRSASRSVHSAAHRRLAVLLVAAAFAIPLGSLTPAEAKPPRRPTTTTTVAPSTTTTVAPSTTTTVAPSTTTTVTPSTTTTVAPSNAGGYPTTPPAQICGNATILTGPATQPANSVRVDPGSNLNDITQANPAGTTFWLAPGTHTLGASEYGQVIPKTANTYIGAPGAILDGKRINRSAFTQQATGVTIKYLTIQGFGPVGSNNNAGVVNQGAATGWTIERNTIRANAGAAVFVGSDNVVRYNCLADNGQYGFSMYRPEVTGGSAITNIILDHNEIAGNNTDDWETRWKQQYGSTAICGCSGGGKFWDVKGATVTNNWVHHNKGVALWADTNNIDFLFEGNYVNDNDHEGLWYEISYNATVRANTFKRNALVKGAEFAARGDAFPVPAVYIAESGGDSRASANRATLEIVGNSFEDNWSGITLWEAAERFCNSPANTSSGYCTKVNPAVTLSTCVEGQINNSPYFHDCRWKTQNIRVDGNEFRHNPANLGNCSSAYCGRMALVASWGTAYPSWSPYLGTSIQDAVTFTRNNRFTNNRYYGPWRFTPYDAGRNVSFATWQAAPYNQDAGSTLASTVSPTTTTVAPVTTTSTVAPATTTTTVAPSPEANALSADTAGLEASTGQWAPWYSTGIARSSVHAHTGSGSLQVDVNAPNGWGVTLNNWPGFVATAGNKTIGFWGRLGSGDLGVTMTVRWRNDAGTDLQVDRVTMPTLSTTWQQVTANVVAPTGTAKVWVELASSSGVAGSQLFLDDFKVTAS